MADALDELAEYLHWKHANASWLRRDDYARWASALEQLRAAPVPAPSIFNRLAESMKQMNEIDRGEREPSRVFAVDAGCAAVSASPLLVFGTIRLPDGREISGAAPAEAPQGEPQVDDSYTGQIARLRRLLAVAYTGAQLYTDDGELQDNRALPFIDFRCDPISVIEAKMRERGRLALAAPDSAAEQAAPAEAPPADSLAARLRGRTKWLAHVPEDDGCAYVDHKHDAKLHAEAAARIESDARVISENNTELARLYARRDAQEARIRELETELFAAQQAALSEGLAAAASRERERALREALRVAQEALRAPLDDWK